MSEHTRGASNSRLECWEFSRGSISLLGSRYGSECYDYRLFGDKGESSVKKIMCTIYQLCGTDLETWLACCSLGDLHRDISNAIKSFAISDLQPLTPRQRFHTCKPSTDRLTLQRRGQTTSRGLFRGFRKARDCYRFLAR